MSQSSEPKQPKDPAEIVARDQRYSSHALVELRRFKHLPFGTQSAVLLDISLSGFKIEFTGEVLATTGQVFWLKIPLAPLGIYAPHKIVCRGECRWFDAKRFRLGGVFMELSTAERRVLDQVIEAVKPKLQVSF